MTDTSKPYKILFIRLDSGNLQHPVEQTEEFSRILQVVQDSNLEVLPDQTITVADIAEKIGTFSPHIIHLSGHGSTSGLVVVGHDIDGKPSGEVTLSQRQIEEIFGAIQEKTKPRLLFINACYAGEIASEMQNSMRNSYNCLIGMKNNLDQNLALEIAESFYRQIAKGETVAAALTTLKSVIAGEKAKSENKDKGLNDGFDPQPTAYGDDTIKFALNSETTTSQDLPPVYADSIKGTPFQNKYNGYIHVSFEATGEWLAIPEEESGVPDHAKGYLSPNGDPNFNSNTTVCARAPLGALVVIGEDKECKAYGAKGSFDLKPGETVYFMMNDVVIENSPNPYQMYQDNKGSINVKLFLTKY